MRLCVSFGDLHTPRYTLVLGLIVMCMWGGSEGARQRVAVVCLSYICTIYTIILGIAQQAMNGASPLSV